MKSKHFFLLGIFIVGIATHSCQGDEDILSNGIPSINRITLIEKQDTVITSADMGTWLAVYGSNLRHINQVKFNDIEIDVKEIYCTDSVLYLQVPLDLPSEISNTIRIKNNAGETSYIFKVNFPPLKITGMNNEYTPAGHILTIYGEYFGLYQVSASTTVVLFGDKEQPVISANDKLLTVQVPEGLGYNTKIKVVNHKFEVSVESPIDYMDATNIITNFDSDYPYTGSDGMAWVGSWNDPGPLSGNYIKFEANPTTYPEGLGWLYLCQIPFVYSEDMILHPENYALKFEIYMKKPLISTQLFMYYYWNQSPGPSPLGGEIIHVRNMNEWETLSIPLEKIIPIGLIGTETVNSLNIRVQCFAPTDELSMYFDNFRIYEKK